MTPGEIAYLRGMLAYIEERPGFHDWPDVTVLHIPEKGMVCVSDGTRAESAPIYDVRLLSDMVHNEWPHIAAEIVRQALRQAGPSDRAELDRMTAHMRELWQMPDLVAVPSGDGWVVDVGWPDGTMIGGPTEWDAVVAACDAARGPTPPGE